MVGPTADQKNTGGRPDPKLRPRRPNPATKVLTMRRRNANRRRPPLKRRGERWPSDVIRAAIAAEAAGGLQLLSHYMNFRYRIAIGNTGANRVVWAGLRLCWLAAPAAGEPQCSTAGDVCFNFLATDFRHDVGRSGAPTRCAAKRRTAVPQSRRLPRLRREQADLMCCSAGVLRYMGRVTYRREAVNRQILLTLPRSHRGCTATKNGCARGYHSRLVGISRREK